MVNQSADYGIIHKALKRLLMAIKRLFNSVEKRKTERLISKAEALRKETGYRYYVIRMKGRLRIVPKFAVKKWCKDGTFRKGTTPEMIEKKAIYITRL